MRDFLIALTRSPLSLLGAALTTASGTVVVVLFAIELVGARSNPYVGILAYLILPAFFVLGLLMIPAGIWRYRRRSRVEQARGEPRPAFPVLDLNVGRTRKILLTLVILTALNLVILATVTYKGVEVMESTEFCGTTCHTVMEPEHTAYQRSPHSRVKCVECHIGPGADWFLRSKFSGARQVLAVALGLYPRPIPTPIHGLRPAHETCEQCHRLPKLVDDRIKVITRYRSDEANTELNTVLLMRVGGIENQQARGIHWHADPRNRIRYRADASRETIYEVELTRADGTVEIFLPGGSRDGLPVSAEWRLMDCVDCHNRPAHAFVTAEHGVDEALRTGRIDRTLPFIRREGLLSLEDRYTSHEDAKLGIAARIEAFYRQGYPDLYASHRSEVASAAATLGEIFNGNVFPAMNVTWGTYPDHVGHEDSPGCFRCHNDDHATVDGEVISQDCFACHGLLAVEEGNPEVLEVLRP